MGLDIEVAVRNTSTFQGNYFFFLFFVFCFGYCLRTMYRLKELYPLRLPLKIGFNVVSSNHCPKIGGKLNTHKNA